MDTLLFHNITDANKEAVSQFLSSYKPIKNEHEEFLKAFKAIGKTLQSREEQQAFDRIMQLFRLIHRKERLIQKTILNLYIPLLDENPNEADLCKLVIEEDIAKLNKMVSDLEVLVHAFNFNAGKNFQSKFFAPLSGKGQPESYAELVPTVRWSGLSR